MPKTILVLDMEEGSTLLKGVLQDYKVVAYNNGQKALDAIPSLKPDLVILEMLMPGMSGKEVCERIRKNPATKTTRVMFVTSAKFSQTGKDVLQKLGVIDTVTKPFDKDDLRARIKNILE